MVLYHTDIYTHTHKQTHTLAQIEIHTHNTHILSHTQLHIYMYGDIVIYDYMFIFG